MAAALACNGGLVSAAHGDALRHDAVGAARTGLDEDGVDLPAVEEEVLRAAGRLRGAACGERFVPAAAPESGCR